METYVKLDRNSVYAVGVNETNLLRDMYREINCDCIETYPLVTPFLLIIDESGALKDDKWLNIRASILAGTAIYGVALIGKIGYRDGEPDIVGLDDQDQEMFMQVCNG